jgi:predicted outer membrane repeat protein
MLGSQSTLSFDASNWSLYQTVTVVGANDVDEVNGSASLTFSAEGITSQLVDVAEKDSGNNSQTGYFFSGIVVNSYGVGIAGAQINFPGAGVSQTNEDGAFYISLPNGWSGSASISAAGYTFSPASHTISSLSAHSLGFISQGTRSNILYVDQDATGSGDGTSWNDAYVDLSAALLSRNPFTEVWVAEGTYLPGVIRASGFVLPPNVPVYGGFSGTESSRAERNATDYPTILSGDIGVLNDSSDNAYNVVIPSNGSLLDGFTIRDGNASKNYGDARGWGAGIFADGISFSIANCTITHNRARSRGGAVFLLDANATFSNCTFSNNYGTAWAEVNSYGYAGAIDLNNTTLILEQCVFTNNQADLNGGAIYGKNSDINATACTFSNNQNTDNNGGGAMYLLDSNLTLQGSYFQSNQSASSSGGAIYFNGGNHVVRDSNFTSNQSNSRGGSLYLIDGNLTLRESVFSSNSSPLDGGAIYAENSDINSSNCRFNSNQNTSNNGGGAISMSAGTLTDLNSTFATNSSNSSNPSAASWGGALAIQSVIAILEKSTFSHNTSTKSGGAIYSSDSNLTLLNGSFQSNESSTGAGGAVYSSDSNLTINDSSFHQNYATSSSGGAISVDETSDISLLDNIFKMNSASFGGAVSAKCPNLRITGGSFVGNWANTGGGIYTQEAVASYLENIIALGNEANATASAKGGFAFFNTGSLGSKFINCVIVGNKSSYRYGVFRPTGATHFINCAIVNNEATSEGGVTLLFDGDSVALENTIMWGNTAGSGNDIYVNTGTASANFSLFDPGQSIGAITGTPVSSSDPLFIDADGTDNIYGTEDDDLRLQASSPAINQGSASVSDYPSTDINGFSRNGSPDIGAYEFYPASAPVFSSATSFSAAENQTGVGTITATDANGDALTYSISGGLDQSLFTINGTTGVLVFNSAPDYENAGDNGGDNIYNLTIQVSDGSLTATQNLTITVTDVNENAPNSAPSGLSTSGNLVMQENEAVGTIVGTFQAQDPDGDSLTYSLVSGVGDGNNSMFTLENNGTLKTAVIFDYELYSSLSIRVSVSDGVNPGVEGNFTVTITDVNETPANSAPVFSSATSFNVAENQTGVGTVTATDTNGDALTYSISGGVDQSLFMINATTGVLVFNSAPDYENAGDNGGDNIYNLTIQVSDGSLSATQNLTITVTDVNETPANSAPVFSSATSLNVAENQTGVGTVTATDTNGDALTYSISGGLDQSLFMINATTGVLVFNSAPDYENAGDNGGDNIYNLTIQVSDGSLSATQNLTITVTDVNETPANNAPVFSSAASFSAAENQTGVGTVTATDTNGDALTYSISGGLDQSLFTINATTGVLVFNSAPDYENAGDNGGDNIYNLIIQVSDGSLSATQNLTITVTDVNETPANNAPVFSSAASFSAAENQTGVGTVTATDTNGDALTYSISGGLDQSLFTINATTGVLVFNSAPDYENAGDNGGDNIYNLIIQVSDGSLSATQNLTITVTDVNETPANSVPVFSSATSFSAAENQTGVGTITATDTNGDALTYSISGGLDQSLFTINATTGVLVFNSAPGLRKCGRQWRR